MEYPSFIFNAGDIENIVRFNHNITMAKYDGQGYHVLTKGGKIGK